MVLFGQARRTSDGEEAFDVGGLPELIARLLAGKQVMARFAGDDLREMGKLGELANLAGLAAHPILRPAAGLAARLAARAREGGLDHSGPGGGGGESAKNGARDEEGAERDSGEGAGAEDEPGAITRGAQLPAKVFGALERGLVEHPSLMVRGWMAGDSPRPVKVAVIVPQHWAQLAAAAERMLWAMRDGAGRAESGLESAGFGETGLPESQAGAAEPQTLQTYEYGLLCWPEALTGRRGNVILRRYVGHWPGERTGIVIGYDDPRLIAALLVDAARREWEIADRGLRIADWKKMDGVDDVDGNSKSEIRNPKLKEPMVVDDEGRAWPVWRNPLAGAAELAGEAGGRRAALAVGALPFGVRVDEAGRFVVFGDGTEAEREAAREEMEKGEAAGCVVVGREASGREVNR